MTTPVSVPSVAPRSTDAAGPVERLGAGPLRGSGTRRFTAVVGLLPFFAFILLFLVWPALTVFGQAVATDDGLTGDHLAEALTGQYRRSFLSSLRLSLVSALLGAVIGTALAYSVVVLRRPRWLRSVATAFSGVAANLGGIPLAFAFLTVLGNQGLLTIVLRTWGIDLLDTPFRIYSFGGLVVVYLYFQIPLMVLVMLPAIDGLQPAWREAATNLGATSWAYWRRIGLPILTPAALGGFLLLFANSFSAYATAYALTTGNSDLVPVQIRFFLQGNTVTGKGALGYALASWMIVIMAASMAGFLLLRRRTARWLR